MKRFHKEPINKWGQTIITDILNTEPVCCIFTNFHPYAPDIIFKALQEYQKEVPNEVLKRQK